MTFLGLDIETIPQPWALDTEHVRPTEAWMKDWGDVPFADELRSGRVPLAQTGTLPATHPTTARIVQVSLGWRGKAGVETKILQLDDYFGNESMDDRMDEWEEALIRDALACLSSAVSKRSVLVTFNGKSFDLPMLRWRAALLKLCDLPRLPWRRLLYPYSDEQHSDLRLAFGNDDRRATGTLQTWAGAFEVHAEEHGADVAAWVEAGEWAKLRQYGVTEQATLIELYEIIAGVL